MDKPKLISEIHGTITYTEYRFMFDRPVSDPIGAMDPVEALTRIDRMDLYNEEDGYNIFSFPNSTCGMIVRIFPKGREITDTLEQEARVMLGLSKVFDGKEFPISHPNDHITVLTPVKG